MTSRMRVLKCAVLVASVTLSAIGLAAGFAAEVSSSSLVTLLGPPDRAQIRFPGPSRATITFAWRAVPAATGYRIVVSRTNDLSQPVVRRTHTDSSVTVRGLPEGRYYWRVEAVGEVAAGVRVSKIATFSIRAAAP